LLGVTATEVHLVVVVVVVVVIGGSAAALHVSTERAERETETLEL